MPPYTNVGTTGHWRLQLSISELGKTFSQRGSRRFGSARAFSLIIESYWSMESSSVFELSTTSRLKNSAYLRTPGILDSCGCHESAQTPFSELTQIPSGVLMQRDWLPSVCPGVETIATPTPSSTSPSRSTRLSSTTLSIPPGTYHAHCIGCVDLKVSTSLRWFRNFASGKKGSFGSRSSSTGSVVPISKRQSCTCRWSKLTKSTSSRRSPHMRKPSSTELKIFPNSLYERNSP